MTYLTDVFNCEHPESGEEILARGSNGLVYCKDCGCHQRIEKWARSSWIIPSLVAEAAERVLFRREDRAAGVLGKDGKPIRILGGLLRRAWSCEHPRKRVYEFWAAKDGPMRHRMCLRTCLDCGCFSRTQSGIDREWYPYFAIAEAWRRRAQVKSTSGGKKSMNIDEYFDLLGG